jgi:hypothetical protein
MVEDHNFSCCVFVCNIDKDYSQKNQNGICHRKNKIEDHIAMSEDHKAMLVLDHLCHKKEQK